MDEGGSPSSSSSAVLGFGALSGGGGEPTAEPEPFAGLRFWVHFPLPPRSELYTLVLFNCAGEHVAATGEASFVGGDGAILSPPQWCAPLAEYRRVRAPPSCDRRCLL